MKRLTRKKDNYECRIKGGCPAEEWMYHLYDDYPMGHVCNNCPFMIYINALAELEDKKEEMENDEKN